MTSEKQDARSDHSPLYLLHRAGQCAETLFQLEMAALELTPRQLTVLLAVSENHGSSQTELVERTGIDRSTMADLVRRLLRKGLLQRQRSKEDTRAYAVNLTERGQLAMKAAVPVAARVDEKLLAVLPERQAKEFLSNLRAIINGVGRPS